MYQRKTGPLLSLLLLAGCTHQANPAEPRPAPGQRHGAIEGAAEVAEPQLQLVTIDEQGHSSMLDLLDGTETDLGTIPAPVSVTTDGRYVFAADDTGVSIIDSGVWTWDHTDHFHYYRAQPRILDRLAGEGVATISTGLLSTAGTTGVHFPGSGEGLLLDNKALSEGRIEEVLRLPETEVVAPFGAGALVGTGTKVSLLDQQGDELNRIDCPDPEGSITTRVGVAIGCADGAVLATAGSSELQHIPYPDDSVSAATVFGARKGRPTVAGAGNEKGIWLLDTRERSWQWLETVSAVVAASAVDDEDEHVVALGEDGTVQVYSAASAALLATSEPLAKKGSLMVDAQRAYVNAPEEDVVYEIDYADSARIARTLETAVPAVHLAEVGR